MTKILHVDASSRSATSVTRQLSKYAVDALLKNNPSAQVKTIDLTKQPPHFITEEEIGAMFTPPDARSAEQVKTFEAALPYPHDWVESDIFVFGVPMYNFSVPGAFKAYIDLCVVVGVTFKFGPEGLQPLLKNKKVIVVNASGSNFESEPMKSRDFFEPYLRAILGFVGITDITFVKAPGHSEDEINASVKRAKAQIDTFAAAQKVATANV